MRLFAGIELDVATRALCVDVQDRLRRAAFEAKYEAPEKFHVTLAFLGNVPDERLNEVRSALNEVAAAVPPTDITWNRFNAFPNERRPRILFVGSRDQARAFRTLTVNVRERYETLGFSFADDAVAHITIGRVKGGSLRPLPILDVTPHAMHVATISLFASLPDQANNTSRYEVIERCSLQS